MYTNEYEMTITDG